MPDSTESDNLVYLDDFRGPRAKEENPRLALPSDLGFLFQVLDFAKAGELHTASWDHCFAEVDVPAYHIRTFREKLMELGWKLAHPGQMGKEETSLLEYQHSLLGWPDVTKGVKVARVPFGRANTPLNSLLGIRCFTCEDGSLDVTTGYFKKVGGTEFFQCGYSEAFVELPKLPVPVFWSGFYF